MSNFITLKQSKNGLIGEAIYIDPSKIVSFTKGDTGATEIVIEGLNFGYNVVDTPEEIAKLLKKSK